MNSCGSANLNSKSELFQFARSLGFRLVGIADPDDLPSLDRYDWWLNQGFAAEMHYLHRQRARRTSLRNLHPSVRSVVVCALPFPGTNVDESTVLTNKSEGRASGAELRGKIARYAAGIDYHQVVGEKLEQIAQALDQSHGIPHSERSLAYVDTGAIPERSLAVLAGLGWIGKNAMLIHPEEGSWFWLGEILTSIRFEPDIPQADRCGTCRRCLDACPTDAILENERMIDSRKCLSYLTIEHRGPIPAEQAPAFQEWLLGCDICQEVCPWNAQSERKARKHEGAPRLETESVQSILAMNAEQFQKRFKDRAHARPKLIGLQRNADLLQKNRTRTLS